MINCTLAQDCNRATSWCKLVQRFWFSNYFLWTRNASFSDPSPLRMRLPHAGCYRPNLMRSFFSSENILNIWRLRKDDKLDQDSLLKMHKEKTTTWYSLGLPEAMLCFQNIKLLHSLTLESSFLTVMNHLLVQQPLCLYFKVHCVHLGVLKIKDSKRQVKISSAQVYVHVWEFINVRAKWYFLPQAVHCPHVHLREVEGREGLGPWQLRVGTFRLTVPQTDCGSNSSVLGSKQTAGAALNLSPIPQCKRTRKDSSE